MNKVLTHIKICRPLNCLIGAFSVIVTASILRKVNDFEMWFPALVVVVFYNAAANIINDYFDRKTDAINRPTRPLITGAVQPQVALIMAVTLFAIGTILALTLPSLATILAVAIALPLIVFYSIWFKRIALIGNIVIAVILGLTFIFAGAALRDWQTMLIPAILAFGLTLVREIIKDIADVEGDRRAKLRTLPVISDERNAWLLASIFAALIAVGVIMPYLTAIYNIWYLVFVIFGIEIPIGYIVFSAMKYPSIETAIQSAKILKLSTIAGVIAVWVGSF